MTSLPEACDAKGLAHNSNKEKNKNDVWLPVNICAGGTLTYALLVRLCPLVMTLAVSSEGRCSSNFY